MVRHWLDPQALVSQLHRLKPSLTVSIREILLLIGYLRTWNPLSARDHLRLMEYSPHRLWLPETRSLGLEWKRRLQL